MSNTDFERSEFDLRHKRARQAMEKAGIDLLIATSPASINYLVGSRSKAYLGFQCLLFPLAPGKNTLLAKKTELAEHLDLSIADECVGHGGPAPEDPVVVLHRLLKERDYGRLRVGLEMPAFYLRPQHYQQIKDLLEDRLVDATSLLEELKFVKSPKEIEYIKRAASMADAGLRAGLAAMKPGRTEFEVVAEINRAVTALGSDQTASPVNMISGERCCYPHGLPTERTLVEGDFVNIEFGAAYRRYCSTIGRQYSIGLPTPRMQEIYDAARAATDACIAAMGPGVPLTVPHEAAKKEIDDRGFGAFRLHTTGYGVAAAFPPSWMDTIQMFDNDPRILEPGMMLSVEPPIFIHSERLGARVIENVLITENGHEVLSRETRDLIVI